MYPVFLSFSLSLPLSFLLQTHLVRLSRLAGLQISGILLANNFSLFTENGMGQHGVTDGVTTKQFFEKVFVCLGSNTKDVYSAAGEGLLFVVVLLLWWWCWDDVLTFSFFSFFLVCGVLANKIKQTGSKHFFFFFFSFLPSFEPPSSSPPKKNHPKQKNSLLRVYNTKFPNFLKAILEKQPVLEKP